MTNELPDVIKLDTASDSSLDNMLSELGKNIMRMKNGSDQLNPATLALERAKFRILACLLIEGRVIRADYQKRLEPVGIDAQTFEAAYRVINSYATGGHLD